MIKKKYRLRASRHVNRAISKGLTYQGRLFRAKAFKKNSADEYSRLAVILSAKKFKTAVLRNLIRRRVKAAFYSSLKEFGGWDIAVFPVMLNEEEFANITDEVDKCFAFLQSRR